MSHVLIVDDEPEGCEAVAGYLRKARHTVECVSGGRAALAALMGKVPDAILLDVQMPGMDGIALLEAMRSYLRWATIPVAIFTAYPEDPRLWHVDGSGVTKVFVKSKVSLDAILEWVNDQSGRAAPLPDPRPPSAGAGA